jgi:hypothetical protein
MSSQEKATTKEGARIAPLAFSKLPGPLQLDNYQRPYVWGREKAEQLVADLKAHMAGPHKDQPYYMGMLLFHEAEDKENPEKSRIYVIDGQQRLTTLAILCRHIKGKNPGFFDFRFRSTVSHQHIREVSQVIEAGVERGNKDLEKVLENLAFTVVTVDRPDLAFTFFDTQNSRGVPLATTDLLKAFHLRSIKGGVDQKKDEEAVQALCARRWEELQIAGESAADGKTRDFAPELFHYYLWRARNWCGQQTIVQETRDQVLDCFQKQVVKGTGLGPVPLYPTPANQLARRLSMDSAGDIRLEAGEIALADRPADLPFSLRQPIHDGLGFFLYTARYAALARRLFKDDPEPGVLKEFREFYEKVAAWNSPYLRQLHRLAVLMYYDQFGEHQLLRFAWALEYVLGAIRLTKQRVFQRSAMKYLEEARFNLLDVIATAYRPEEVLEFLMRPEHNVGNEAKLEKAYSEGRPAGNGVQGRYYDQLAAYFKEQFGSDDLRWAVFTQLLEAQA